MKIIELHNYYNGHHKTIDIKVNKPSKNDFEVNSWIEISNIVKYLKMTMFPNIIKPSWTSILQLNHSPP